MRILNSICVALPLAWLCSISAAQQPSDSEETAVKPEAAELFAAGEYKEALEVYQERLKDDPKNQTLLFNAGQSAFLIGEFEAAQESWLKLEKLAGDDDLTTKEKLIQTYSRLEDEKEAGKRIAALKKLRQKTKEKGYREKDAFCRDQFVVDGQRVLVFEHFDYPEKDEVRYSAYLLDKKTGNPTTAYRLWSSKMTNAIAREQGELKDGERLVHLDAYESGGLQVNYLHTKDKYSYTDFRKQVSEIIKGR